MEGELVQHQVSFSLPDKLVYLRIHRSIPDLTDPHRTFRRGDLRKCNGSTTGCTDSRVQHSTLHTSEQCLLGARKSAPHAVHHCLCHGAQGHQQWLHQLSEVVKSLVTVRRSVIPRERVVYRAVSSGGLWNMSLQVPYRQ